MLPVSPRKIVAGGKFSQAKPNSAAANTMETMAASGRPMRRAMPAKVPARIIPMTLAMPSIPSRRLMAFIAHSSQSTVTGITYIPNGTL